MRIDDVNLHDSLLMQVGLGPRRELRLDVFIPDVTTSTMRGKTPLGRRLTVRFGAIDNYPNVERFFLGGPLVGGETCLDEITDFKHTRVGWSLELERRGRVAIKTKRAPTVECGEEAG